jgi:hypothetical protein
MAQMVPCSAFSPAAGAGPFQGGVTVDSGRDGGSTSLGCYDGQVPSSPTLSWTGGIGSASPPSYWAESHPQQLWTEGGSPASCSPVPPTSFPWGLNPVHREEDTSLEQLLEDYTYFGEGEESSAGGHALLRQCLRPSDPRQRSQLEFLNQIGSAIASQDDHDVIIKPHLWGSSNSNSNNSQQQGLASVLNLVMEQVNQEVRSTCHILGVSPNPNVWSVDDVKAWLVWTGRQCGLAPLPLDRFQMEGSKLTAMTEEEFRLRAPLGGDTLYAKLDIWRSAWNNYQQQQQQQQQQVTSPPATSAPPPPTIQVDESCLDVSQMLAWINSCSSPSTEYPAGDCHMLSAPSPCHLLTVPGSPASSFHRGGASPYSDRTHSSCEDFSSEVEELEEEDDDDSEMKEDVHRPSSSSAGSSTVTTTGGSNGSHIHLWQFLKELLSAPALHGSAIRWLDRPRGVFKIEDSVRVARLWGKRKNRPAMNYDKLSRSIRQYYRKGIMKKTERSQRLVYQFCHPYAL